MALNVFWALARVPIAEAIALAFVAPLMALYRAAIFLCEKIGPRSIAASLPGLAGVIVIVAGKPGGDYSDEALWAVGAVFLSASFYAYNLILARRQAKLAEPMEIAFFQNFFVAAILAVGPLWFLAVPAAGQPPNIRGAGLSAT